MDITENIISWNFANWVTVVLMAVFGYALFALLIKTINMGNKGELQNA